MRVLRIQDHKGRGPWRPGLSEKWVDAWRTAQLPPIYEEIPDFVSLVNRSHFDGFHVGCAVRQANLLSWFSITELSRLSALGFGVVDASECVVLAETKHQLLIGSKRPLRELPSAILETEAAQ